MPKAKEHLDAINTTTIKEKITWISEKRKMSSLIPADYNPRKITEKQAKELKASLDKFALADPLVINKDNKIIGGHQRFFILKAAGETDEIDVRVPDRQLNEEEERELNVRLNKNLADWDQDLLANFDEDLLKTIGFESAELDRIFQLNARPDEDDVPQDAPPVAQRGDIWVLGGCVVCPKCGKEHKL